MNPSFEQDSLSGNFQAGSALGWAVTSSAGVLLADPYFDDPAPDGTQVLYMTAGATAAQTSLVSLAQGDVILVTFSFGHRLTLDMLDCVALVTSSSTTTELGSLTVARNQVPVGRFTNFALEFTVPAGVDGESMVVEFFAGSGTGQVIVDNVEIFRRGSVSE